MVRSAVGGGGRFGAIHSQFHATWYQGIPGLKIVSPSTPAEAKGLLKAAIRDDNPVLFLEHKRLYSVKGPPPQDGDVPALGQARVAREGADVTLVSIAKGVPDSLAAAERLDEHGIDAEVIDPAHAPAAGPRHGAALGGQDQPSRGARGGPRLGGWAAGLVGAVGAEALHDLDDVWVIATDELPIPYSPPLEDAFMPSADTIADEVRRRLDGAPE